MPVNTHEWCGFPASEVEGGVDAENRLISVTITATGHRTEFGYDGMGRRVEIIEKDPDATQTLQITSDKKYLWDGVEIAEERDSTGANVLKRFYPQGFVDSDGTVLFYTRDHLGSIRELTDSTQAVRARYDYDPYGRMTKVQGDKDSVFGFTGHFWHAQSGLGLTMYRAYDSNLGRWISRDPIEETGDTNLYRYALGNPVLFVDPLGLDVDSWGRSCSKCEMTKINIWNDIPPGIPHTFFTVNYPGGTTWGGGFYPQAPYHNQAIMPGNPVPGEVRPNTFHPPVNEPGHDPSFTFLACPESVNQFWHGLNLTMRDPKFQNYDLYNIFGGNCTSFVCSVLENAGIRPPLPSNTPLLNPWSLAGAAGGRH